MTKTLHQILADQIQQNVDEENFVKAVLAKVKIRAGFARSKISQCRRDGLTVDETAQKLRRCE